MLPPPCVRSPEQTSRETVVDGANRYGPEAGQVVAGIVDLDPLEMLPKRIPKTPVWVDVSSLPLILNENRSAALPTSAVSTILTMLRNRNRGRSLRRTRCSNCVL